MPVPYLFSNVPGGTSIPLAELDANFAYLTSGTPQFLNLAVAGTLTVGGTTALTGTLTTNDVVIDGTLTLNGHTIAPTGTTGTGLLVFNTSPTLISPTLGTPVSGDLANCTSFPTAQLTGLASGMLSFLTTPSSATLAAIIGDETGTGQLVFNSNATLSSPILTTPTLGTPVSGNLSACTGVVLTGGAGVTGILPITFGGTGLNAVGPAGSVLTSDGVQLQYLTAPPAVSVAGGTASQILYQSAPNVTDFIPNGSVNQVLLSNGASVPSWGLVDLVLTTTNVLPIAKGGTNATTRQQAMDTFAGAVTLGQYLRGDGTNVVMSAIQAADVPTLNQNTTGSAATFTSTSQDSQFNSIGVNVAPSGVPGEIKATGNITTTTGYFIDSTGNPLHSLTSGTAVAASGASVVIGSIPSWVTRLTLIWDSVTQTGGQFPQVQLGTSGGIVTTGYSSTASNFSSGFTSTTGFVVPYTNGAFPLSAIFTFTKITANTWVAAYTLVNSLTANQGLGGGRVALGGALTQISSTFYIAGPTYNGGTINIQYE